jgi:CheY-like chemotaxis protein
MISKATGSVVEAGMNDFLAKPVVPQALHSIVMRWLTLGSAPLRNGKGSGERL